MRRKMGEVQVKCFFIGKPKQVERLLTYLESTYNVITHYKQKDHFNDQQIRVGTSLDIDSRKRMSVCITTADGKEIHLQLLDGKVIKMDGSTLIMGKTLEPPVSKELEISGDQENRC
jgi:ACT domain-containing protein